MKITFCFLVVDKVKNTLLWQDFFSKNTCEYEIIIHSKNKNNNYKDYSVFKDKIIKKTAYTKWGHLMNAQQKMWKSVDQNSDYYVLLSESCIPLNSFGILHNYLNSCNNKSLLFYNDIWWKQKDTTTFNWKGAHQWIIFNNRHLKLLSDKNLLKQIHKKVEHADDESFPATALSFMNKLESECIHKKTTFVDWNRNVNRMHPYTFINLTTDDWKMLEDAAETHFFARKFNELSINDKKKVLTIINKKKFIC